MQEGIDFGQLDSQLLKYGLLPISTGAGGVQVHCRESKILFHD